MKKTNKKEEKKKSGKQADASQEELLATLSAQWEKEFNKKMKEVVKEVKKDTKKAIKEIMSAARQRIQDNAALIGQDLLKNADLETQSVPPSETEQPTSIEASINNIPAPTDQLAKSGIPEKEQDQTNLTPASPKATSSRVRKTKATPAAASANSKPTSTRKPRTPKANPSDEPETESA